MTRKWSLILTGPNSGCIAKEGDPWAHSPEHFERVAIMEIPQDGEPVAAVEPAPMALPANPAPASKKEPTRIIVNEPVDDLARSLGLVFNDMVPHNAGWFVPGYQRGYPSAADAIKGLFALVKSSALSKADIAALPTYEQPSLF